MQKKKVIVVGAGFAGITAARTLLAEAAAPLDVIVLEASSRVGGRACTTEVLSWARHAKQSTCGCQTLSCNDANRSLRAAAKLSWERPGCTD